MSPIAAAWFDAWTGRDPRSDDGMYVSAFRDALAAVARADARPVVNATASKSASGKVRARAKAGMNTFIFSDKAQRPVRPAGGL